MVADILAAVAEWERTRRRRSATANVLMDGSRFTRPTRRSLPTHSGAAQRASRNDRQDLRMEESGDEETARESGVPRSRTLRYLRERECASRHRRQATVRCSERCPHTASGARGPNDEGQAADWNLPARFLWPHAESDSTAPHQRPLPVVLHLQERSCCPCDSRAYINAETIDRYVEQWFARALATVSRRRRRRGCEPRARARAIRAAAQLRAYVETASALDAQLFLRRLVRRCGRWTQTCERPLLARHPQTCSGGLRP
jgi:hypothetical protein